MPTFHFIEGGSELLDAIGPLWKKLTLHHSGISRHFSGQFASMEFPERKHDLQEKAAAGKVRIAVARAAGNKSIGYCVAAIDAKGRGEIESLYVEAVYRSQGIGTALVQRILLWFDAENVTSASVNVAVGNESAFRFYEQWGFYPRVTALVRKDKIGTPNR